MNTPTPKRLEQPKQMRGVFLGGFVIFFLLSGIDLAQTYALITGGCEFGEVSEGNPVAAAWLDRHGWTGLAAFKAGTMAVFTGAVALLAPRRPRVSGALVGLACTVLFLVAARSQQLLDAAPTEIVATEKEVQTDYLSKQFLPS